MHVFAHNNIEQLHYTARFKKYLPILDRPQAVIGEMEGESASDIGREPG